MSRRTILGIALACLAALTLAIAPWTVNTGRLTAAVARQLRSVYGLDLAVKGRTTIALLPVPRMKFENVALAVPGSPPLVDAEQLRSEFRIWPLLIGRIELAEVALSGAQLRVEEGKRPVVAALGPPARPPRGPIRKPERPAADRHQLDRELRRRRRRRGAGRHPQPRRELAGGRGQARRNGGAALARRIGAGHRRRPASGGSGQRRQGPARRRGLDRHEPRRARARRIRGERRQGERPRELHDGVAARPSSLGRRASAVRRSRPRRLARRRLHRRERRRVLPGGAARARIGQARRRAFGPLRGRTALAHRDARGRAPEPRRHAVSLRPAAGLGRRLVV